MRTLRRAARRTVCGAAAAAALGALLGAPAEARADTAETAVLATTLIGFAAADISFAVHDLDAAVKNQLAQDGWLYAETIVAAPQVALFNTILVGANASGDRLIGEIATFLGILPTAGVNALMMHGIWGLTSDRPPADANAGISVLVGTNFALSMVALGRAIDGHLSTRPVGVLETILAGTTTAISAYESGIKRPQQGPWIALTAWSGALALHGIISAALPDVKPEPRARQRGAFRLPFTVVPSVIGGGPTAAPGVVAAGRF